MNAELLEDVVGVGQDVHQVGDRGALVAGDVRHAGLQQGLGHGQDAFAAELLALAQAELASPLSRMNVQPWGFPP